MADNNFEIRALESENEFLRATISEHQLQFDLMTKREDKLKNIIEDLQQQRNQSTEDYKCLSTTAKDKIHQLKNKIKQYEAQIQDHNNKFEENRLQYTVVQKQLINTLEKLNNSQEKLINIQERLNNKQEELAKSNRALFEKSTKVRDLQDKLEKNETKYNNLRLLNEMALVRGGLTKFENTKIPHLTLQKEETYITIFVKIYKERPSSTKHGNVC